MGSCDLPTIAPSRTDLRAAMGGVHVHPDAASYIASVILHTKCTKQRLNGCN
jgi:hypothetical protein